MGNGGTGRTCLEGAQIWLQSSSQASTPLCPWSPPKKPNETRVKSTEPICGFSMSKDRAWQSRTGQEQGQRSCLGFSWWHQGGDKSEIRGAGAAPFTCAHGQCGTGLCHTEPPSAAGALSERERISLIHVRVCEPLLLVFLEPLGIFD